MGTRPAPSRFGKGMRGGALISRSCFHNPHSHPLRTVARGVPRAWRAAGKANDLGDDMGIIHVAVRHGAGVAVLNEAAAALGPDYGQRGGPGMRAALGAAGDVDD